MISKGNDRKAIRSLRVGVVPSSHVLGFTVGSEQFQNALEKELGNLPIGRQKSCIICGEWGTGKSNLLKYLKEFALIRNTAVAYISLNGRSSAVNHPQRFYHHIVADLKVREIPGKGIITLLLRKLKDQAFLDKTNEWISLNRHHSELARALENLLSESGGLEWSLPIILGTDLSWSDYAYKKEKAIKRIDDLGSYLRKLGFNGLMVQFDELETIDQLWNSRSRQSAYKVLLTLTSFKNVWSVFAGTEKFNQRLISDKNSGIINDGNAMKFAENFFRFPIIRPPIFNLKLAEELLFKIEKLYRGVYEVSTEANLHQILERWTQMPFRNPRRLIRHAIDYLDCHRSVATMQRFSEFPVNQNQLTPIRLSDSSAQNKKPLGIGMTFDAETYLKIKPHFQKAWDEAKRSGHTLEELANNLIDKYGDKVVPYIKAYVDEQTGEMQPKKIFTVGDSVIVTSGPFRGFVFNLKKIDGEKVYLTAQGKDIPFACHISQIMKHQ